MIKVRKMKLWKETKRLCTGYEYFTMMKTLSINTYWFKFLYHTVLLLGPSTIFYISGDNPSDLGVTITSLLRFWRLLFLEV